MNEAKGCAGVLWTRKLIGTMVPPTPARDLGRCLGFAIARRPPLLYTEPYGSLSANPPGCLVCRALRRHPTWHSGAARAGGRFDNRTCREVPNDPHRHEEAHRCLGADGARHHGKSGRVRTCKLGPRRLEVEATWIESYRQLWHARFDEVDKIVEELKRTERVHARQKRKVSQSP